jgi:amino acid adenylation domain-containing protein
VLGVLAAGGVYVPVGTDQPVARRGRIYRAAGVRCVLTGAAERTGLDWPDGVPVVPAEDAEELAGLDRVRSREPGDLAYVIYTSGSTGEPKGVEITHRSALNTVADLCARWGVGAGDRVLAVSALDFDLSVFDLFGLLSSGGSVVLVTEEDRREAARWVELAAVSGVTVWNSVPALLDMALVAGQSRPGWGDRLRLVLVSGDWVGLDLPGRLAGQCGGARLVALGGATEASIWSNAFEVERVEPGWRSVPYGFPLRNQVFRVVDGRGRDCPDWVAGELWIGGLGVARGYRGDPERTAAQFVVADGVRWYRTGDLGRYWPDGTLEFLGRRDFQVKVGGHRIELGEVEAALASHPQVAAAVAVTVAAGGRARRLTAVVVPAAGENPGEDRLREFCGHQLPAYMVPERVVVTGEFPLTANGKIDRAAVADLAGQVTRPAVPSAAEPPRGPVETTLARLWARLLNVPAISRGDNFFTLGGDSLLATQLVEEVRRQLPVAMTLRMLLGAPTVAELAAVVRSQADALDSGLVEEGVI